MGCITKTVFRTALIGGLAVGGLTLVAGPQRVAGGFAQIRHSVTSWFDDNMEDPVVLRHQLKRLQEEYPNRLRKITRSLAEVEGQIRQIEYYKEVSANAVNIAKNDLASLKGLVSTAQAEFASYNGVGSAAARTVLIRFQGSNLSIDQAYRRAHRIKASAMTNQDKVASFARELEVLNSYRDRLIEQKDKLEKEYSTFQAQLWNIQRQIDQIERNESLIALMKECDSGLAENDKFKVRNLDELSNRLTGIQKAHDAELDTLSQSVMTDSYEDRARDAMRSSGESFDDVFSWTNRDDRAPAAQSSYPNVPVIVDESMVEEQRQQIETDTIARLGTSSGAGRN